MYLLVMTAEEHMGQTSTAYQPNGKKPLERDMIIEHPPSFIYNI
jgi:hypothetical protein